MPSSDRDSERAVHGSFHHSNSLCRRIYREFKDFRPICRGCAMHVPLLAIGPHSTVAILRQLGRLCCYSYKEQSHKTPYLASLKDRGALRPISAQGSGGWRRLAYPVSHWDERDSIQPRPAPCRLTGSVLAMDVRVQWQLDVFNDIFGSVSTSRYKSRCLALTSGLGRSLGRYRRIRRYVRAKPSSRTNRLIYNRLGRRHQYFAPFR